MQTVRVWPAARTSCGFGLGCSATLDGMSRPARRFVRLTAALIALECALGLLPVSMLAAQGGAAFTPDEIARLEAGKLVTRPTRVHRDGMSLIGGSSWRVIDAPPELVWRALHDFEHYPNMMPQVIEARPLANSGDERSLYIRNGRWPIFASYYLLLNSDREALTIKFHLDHERPHGVNECWGFVRLVPHGARRTLMTFGVLADLGHGILVAVGASIFQSAVLEVPSTVKKFLESGGRDLYREPASHS